MAPKNAPDPPVCGRKIGKIMCVGISWYKIIWFLDLLETTVERDRCSTCYTCSMDRPMSISKLLISVDRKRWTNYKKNSCWTQCLVWYYFSLSRQSYFDVTSIFLYVYLSHGVANLKMHLHFFGLPTILFLNGSFNPFEPPPFAAISHAKFPDHRTWSIQKHQKSID